VDDETRQRLAAVQERLAALTARLDALEAGEFHLPGEGFRIGTLRLFEKKVGNSYHLHQREEDGTETDLT